MASALRPPDDESLRGFLLGTLPPDRVEGVRAWLDTDPANAARLDRLAARDPLTDALSDSTAEDQAAPGAVERVVRGASEALRRPPETGAEPAAPLDPGGTVRQTHPPGFAPAQPWPPARLGEYRVVRVIGRGGMGVVLEVADDKLGRRVAVKVLNPDVARKPDAAPRFLREARAAAGVEHENVVPILHVGEDAGTPYIVMPLLKGESLADRLKRGGALPATDVVRVGRDVASGLAAAHARGLVHRDMKPANVWLDAETGRARVLDFGLARQGDGADALTEAGALQGTPAYMAPEQIDGQPGTPRSDLFALGAILYECATGRRAFAGATITAILKAVATHDPAPAATHNPAVPRDLSDLIQRLLAKDPTARLESAAAVVSALTQVPVTSGAATRTWVDRDRAAPATRRRGWLVGAVAAVLIIVAGGLWWATRPPDTANNTPPATPPLTPPKVEPTRYSGKVEVLVERDGRLLRLNETAALPLKQTDKFRIEGEVDPPAYLYVIWVDPDRDITPVYPWNAAQGWGSRPAKEEAVSKVSLPPNVGNRYTAPKAKPGVATMVLFATAEPLRASDDAIQGWFTGIPELPLPQGGDRVAVWFDNFLEVKDPLRLRTFGEVGSDDAFARWQGVLQKALKGQVLFQSAVSFARTGGK